MQCKTVPSPPRDLNDSSQTDEFMPQNISAHLARIPDVLETEKKELDTETRYTFDRKTEPYNAQESKKSLQTNYRAEPAQDPLEVTESLTGR